MIIINNKKRNFIPTASNCSLLSMFNWDSFITSTSNRGAYEIARIIVNSQNTFDFTDVCIFYGKKCLGKSHLLRCIAYEFLKTQPDKNIIYMDAEDFIWEIRYLSVNGDTSSGKYREFVELYSDTDLMIVDDIEKIIQVPDAWAVFEEIFLRLDDLHKQLVISSNGNKDEWDKLYQLVQARKCNIISMQMEEPDKALCKNILVRIVERANMGEFSLTDEMIDYITENCNGDLRYLTGMCSKVIATMKLEGKSVIDFNEMKKILEPILW